jgi:hypothetical protein
MPAHRGRQYALCEPTGEQPRVSIAMRRPAVKIRGRPATRRRRVGPGDVRRRAAQDSAATASVGRPRATQASAHPTRRRELGPRSRAARPPGSARRTASVGCGLIAPPLIRPRAAAPPGAVTGDHAAVMPLKNVSAWVSAKYCVSPCRQRPGDGCASDPAGRRQRSAARAACRRVELRHVGAGMNVST